MVFKISIVKLLSLVSILLFVVCFGLFAQDVTPMEPLVPDHTLVARYWPVVALAVSEVLAFLPSKAKGIVSGALYVLNGLFSLLTKKKGN